MPSSAIALSLVMFFAYINEDLINGINGQFNWISNADGCDEKVVQCAVNTYPPPESWRIPEFVINLDLPPNQRWNQVTRAYANELQNLLWLLKNLTEPLFHGHLINFIDKQGPRLVETLPYPFADEMKGVANASGIPLGEVALYNVFYEFFTVCTSILAQTDSGKLYHARNLDFGLLLGWDPVNQTWMGTEILRRMTVQLHFQREGQTVFKSTSFAGYIGVLTGMKPQMFSLTIDERFKFVGGYIGILKWIFGYRSSSWLGFLTRRVFENSTSYVEVQKLLVETELLAPVYFILGGNKSGEACIITRGLNSVDVWEIGAQNASSWYMVETNYDHWNDPPCFDDRRNPAKKCLNELGQKKLSFAGLFDVLSTRPVLNMLTTYSTLMEVASGKFESYQQYCPKPCPMF